MSTLSLPVPSETLLSPSPPGRRSGAGPGRQPSLRHVAPAGRSRPVRSPLDVALVRQVIVEHLEAGRAFQVSESHGGGWIPELRAAERQRAGPGARL